MASPDDQLPEKINPPLQATHLLDRVSGIIESARERVVQSVNHELVLAYWNIGREIVTELQQGEQRAEYGKYVVKQLSENLQKRFGKGYSERNLELFRKFYLAYSQKLEKPNTPCSESPTSEKGRTACALSYPNFQPNLSWSHYRVLMRVENHQARDFYESEAAIQSWSVRQLDRQVHTLFYERILKSSDKQGMLQASQEENAPLRPIDVLKDPYVLEFLDLPESNRLQESELETALVSSLRDFLLELGSGFAFVARQKLITHG
jgi:predicted nuclease of restriction endonuclease-like (RecB) superfamily